jgi:hypothetical protein
MHRLVLVYRFVLHILAGVFLFSLIGAAAALLNRGSLALEHSGVSPLALLVLHGLEIFLLGIDCLCLVVFVVAEAWTFLRDVIRSARSRDHETGTR